MPKPDEYAEVVAVLSESVRESADLSMIELDVTDIGRVVTVRTRTPGALIGRRGATADALRTKLADELGDPALRLNLIGEPPGQSPEQSGLREPRRPPPGLSPASETRRDRRDQTTP